MPKKVKDALITKKTIRVDSHLNEPSAELFNLIELVNEFGVFYRDFDRVGRLDSSRMILEKLNCESNPNADVDPYLKNKFRSHNDLTSAKPVKKRKSDYIPGNSPDPPPFIPVIESVTNAHIVREIRVITKDLPKLYNFLFGENQKLYPTTNIRYVKNTNGEWHEKIEGVIEKYDEILLFAANLTQMASLSNIHIKKFGIEQFNQMTMRQNYYLDMPSSRYYISNSRFSFELDLLAQHLQGVEAARLRYCLICHSIFWAKNLRMEFCSSKCRNKKNSRKWLSNSDNKDKFLLAKREKYAANKPNSKSALLQQVEIKKHEEWRKKRDRDFSKKD